MRWSKSCVIWTIVKLAGESFSAWHNRRFYVQFSCSFMICSKHSGAFSLVVFKIVFKRSLHFIASHAVSCLSSEGQQLGLQLQRRLLCPREDQWKLQNRTCSSTSQELTKNPRCTLLPPIYFAGLQWVTENFPGQMESDSNGWPRLKRERTSTTNDVAWFRSLATWTRKARHGTKIYEQWRDPMKRAQVNNLVKWMVA